MTQFRKNGVRCDGCGRISMDSHGEYYNTLTKTCGNISSHGRECKHDYCDECLSDGACPNCPSPSTMIPS